MSQVNGGESAQQDANLEESSVPQNQPDSNEPSAQAAAGSEPESQIDKQVPFHEHPRFKELIEYRRQSEERQSQQERQMQDLQRQYQEALSRIPQPEKPKNSFITKLGEIDPVYGQTMEEIYNKAQSVDELKQELQQFKYEQLLSKYESTVSRAQAEVKTTPEIHGFIKSQLDAEARAGSVNLNNAPARYKQLAEQYTKYADSIRRSTTASYVVDKSKDAASPSTQPKGKTPPRNDRGQFTGDWEADKASIVSRALKRAKASSDI